MTSRLHDNTPKVGPNLDSFGKPFDKVSKMKKSVKKLTKAMVGLNNAVEQCAELSGVFDSLNEKATELESEVLSGISDEAVEALMQRGNLPRQLARQLLEEAAIDHLWNGEHKHGEK